MADTTTVVLVPESGDSIRVMKAGLMEIADVFAVNKCDRPEADKMERELTNLVALNHEMSHASWANPVIQTQRHPTAVRRPREGHPCAPETPRPVWRTAQKARNNVIREAQEILLENAASGCSNV